MTHSVPPDKAPVPAPNKAPDKAPVRASVPALASGRSAASPPRRRWPIVLALLAGVAFLLVFFIGSTELLHYTESTAFCSLCHVMKPEVTAYHNSAHARAECGTCHIGPGAVPAIQAKLANVRKELGALENTWMAHPAASKDIDLMNSRRSNPECCVMTGPRSLK